VDVVGDVLDSSVLQAAGIPGARALVLALDSDDATLFATVIARDAAPDVPIVARVNHSRNVENIYRAGADYALSISDVSGEMLFSRLLGGEARAREEHRVVRELPGEEFAGQSVSQLALRDRGCSLLAIGRGGELIEFTPDTRVERDDVLHVCGTR
jgi:Trk K+ transport system NAD-binding subunit